MKQPDQTSEGNQVDEILDDDQDRIDTDEQQDSVIHPAALMYITLLDRLSRTYADLSSGLQCDIMHM